MITAPPKKEYPLVPEDHYLLKVAFIKDKPQVATQYGPRDKIAFGFEVMGTKDDEGKPLVVWADFYKSFGSVRKPSRLAVFVEKILGRKLTDDDRQGFDEATLKDLTIEADIEHNTYNGKTYANISEFYKNRKKATPQTEAEEVPF